MAYTNKELNLVLSGGGIKGLAYVGVLEAVEERGISLRNVAGASVGAMMGALVGAGYSSSDMRKILSEFDLGKVDMSNISEKVPAVSRYLQYRETLNTYEKNLEELLFRLPETSETKNRASDWQFSGGYRGGFLKKIVTFCNEGCLFDGDYIEEWISKLLRKRGICTFADLRGGIVDKANPEGYRLRMTAVDANRSRLIVLPDEIGFYGINPDKLEVAKAVMMSSSIPFAFKPVVLSKKENGVTRTYHIIDGGVMDNFPLWLIDKSNTVPRVGFVFDKSLGRNFGEAWTPILVLKTLIAAAYSKVLHSGNTKIKNVTSIDIQKVSGLDFNINDENREYLYSQGKIAALRLFDKLNSNGVCKRYRRYSLFDILFRLK